MAHIIKHPDCQPAISDKQEVGKMSDIRKIYGYKKPVSIWNFNFKSKHRYTNNEMELQRIISNEIIILFEKLFKASKGFFRPSNIEYFFDMAIFPDGYLDKFKSEGIISPDELIEALKSVVNHEGHRFFEAIATGDLFLSINDSNGNIIEDWINSQYPYYEEPIRSLPGEILYFRIIFDMLNPETMEYNLRIITHSDIWYNTRFFDKLNKNPVDTNKEIGTLNRTKLMKCLQNIRAEFPDAIITEEEERNWEGKEPKITLQED